MGITQTMYLELVKNLNIWGRKKKFVNYRFRFTTEIKRNETEKLWGLENYELDVRKKICGKEAKKWRVLSKLWICFDKNICRRRIMGFGQTMDLMFVKK